MRTMSSIIAWLRSQPASITEKAAACQEIKH